ncbi:MAG: hypothetical protein WC385_02615 [Candidatus Paceibacterota bacterium]|jgi:hypothetical protein
MSQNIRKLFEATQAVGLSADLDERVYARLEQEQKKLAKRHLLIFGLADAFSAVGLVVSVFYLVNLSAGSGFYNYLSLFWSDGGSIALYWHELALSLVESLPMLGVIIFLGVALILLLSLAKTLSNLKAFYYQTNSFA